MNWTSSLSVDSGLSGGPPTPSAKRMSFSLSEMQRGVKTIYERISPPPNPPAAFSASLERLGDRNGPRSPEPRAAFRTATTVSQPRRSAVSPLRRGASHRPGRSRRAPPEAGPRVASPARPERHSPLPAPQSSGRALDSNMFAERRGRGVTGGHLRCQRGGLGGQDPILPDLKRDRPPVLQSQMGIFLFRHAGAHGEA